MKEKQSSYTYMAVFQKEKDGYSVRFPQLDGCLTEGDDFQSALRMAQEAMSLHLYGMEQDGEEIPEPVLEPMEVAPGEVLVPVTVWMTPFREAQENRAVKKTLTIPAWLNDAAEKRKVNYSQLLQSALKDYLGIYRP